LPVSPLACSITPVSKFLVSIINFGNCGDFGNFSIRVDPRSSAVRFLLLNFGNFGDLGNPY